MISPFDITLSDLPVNRDTSAPGATHPLRQPIPVSYIDTRMVPLDQIKAGEIESAQQIAVRTKEDQIHIALLQSDLESGVRVGERLPCLYLLDTPYVDKDGTTKQYEIADGWHRVQALKNLGVNQYPFDVYRISAFNPTEKENADCLAKVYANSHPPAKRNGNEELINTYGKLIRNGMFLDSLGEVDKDLLKTELGTFGVKVTKRLVTEILEASGRQQPTKFWAGKQAKDWIVNNLPSYTLGEDGGNLWIFNYNNGTWERTFLRMLKHFNANGRTTIQKIILNPNMPDPVLSRKTFASKIRRMWDTVGSVSGGNTPMEDVFEIAFAFPQVLGKESMTTPIDMKAHPYI